MKTMKNAAIISAIFVILAITVIFFLFTGSNTEPRQCTMEAKQCPDGSYVGRTGPNCEFAACPGGNGDDAFKTTGTIMGKVSIGPLCPVERPGVKCGPDDIYSSRQVVFTPQGGGRPANLPFYVGLNPDGTFRDEIPEGNYSVTITDCNFLGCRYAVPKNVYIEANKTVTMDIDIDTGIR